jgi:hypothetical protein
VSQTVREPGSRGTAAQTAGEPLPRPRQITLRFPWRGPAPDELVDPAGAHALQVATARYVGGIFVLAIVLQRFAVPGVPAASALVPLVIGWGVWGILRGIVEVDRTRVILWLAAAGTSALVVPFQLRLDRDPLVSPTAYALLFVVWLPAILRMKDRRRSTFVLALRYLSYGAAGLAAGCVVMMLSQLAGVPYTDYLAQVVPGKLLLNGFVITYPITFGSQLYRANAWIGLEPSIVSIMMGVGLVSGLLSGVRIRVLVLIVAGLVCATAGSGLAVILVAFAVMLGYPVRNNLVRYVPIAVIAGAALVVTPFGQAILNRVTEAGDQQSSTSLRGILPYSYMWPQWLADPMSVLLGRGPGSSQDIIGHSGIIGLLVPTPIKIFFEYGLVAGLLVAMTILFAYVGGPSRSLPVTLVVSLWLLQPGTTTMVVVLPVYLTSTWWAPRFEPVLESDTATYAAARGWLQRAGRWRPLQGVGSWRLGRRRGHSSQKSGSVP